MTGGPVAERKGGFWRGVGRVLKVLLRLTVVLIFGVLLGAGLYLGVPWLYETMVRPVERNTTELALLSERLAQEQARAQEEAESLNARIASLEARTLELRETTAGQAQTLGALDEELQTVGPRLDELEGFAAETERTVSSLAGDLATIERNLARQGTLLESQQAALAALREDVDATTVELQDQMALLTAATEPLAGHLALLQVAQDLLRVRVLLLEDNVGAARATLLLAAEHVEQAAALMPAFAEIAPGFQERMLLLDGLIAERSFRVTPTLDALWADVMDLVIPRPLSAVMATETLTATNGITVTEVVTP